MTMKTEIDRICGIMYTLLEHQPVIDVPYEKINDIAVALVKEAYGDISEYKAEIERLKDQNNELKIKNWSLEEELKKKELEITYARNNGYEKGYDECEEYTKDKIKQAQIDVLNKVKDIVFDYLGVKNIKEAEALSLLDSTLTYDVVTCGIDELIKEVENE